MRLLLTGSNGYIGSALTKYFNGKHKVKEFDLSSPYWSITQRDIYWSDAIIHLAGHSSVQWCEYDPIGSMKNNCIFFFNFIKRIPEEIPIIYASSGSVYGSSDLLCREKQELKKPLYAYDAQKQMIDTYMWYSRSNYYGLRFGTVCGKSPKPRNELLINAMIKSAIEKDVVTVSGGDCFRAILGMHDLCRAVDTILEKRERPGIYNLASFNNSILNIGKEVSETYGKKLEVTEGGGNGLSFRLDTSKFEKEFDFRFVNSIQDITAAASTNDFSLERRWDTKIL